MKKRFLILLFTAILATLLSACGKGEPAACAIHSDADEDGICNSCGAQLEKNEPEEPEEPKDDEPEGISLIEDGEANFAFVTEKNSI